MTDPLRTRTASAVTGPIGTTPTGTGAAGTGSGDAGPSGAAPGASTPLSPTGRRIWARSRGLLAAAVALLLFGIGYAALAPAERHGRLDPRSTERTGSRAVAQLLADRGVTVRTVTTTAEAAALTGPGSTLLVTAPDLLVPSQQDTLRRAGAGGGTTVLVAPTRFSLEGLAPGVEETGRVRVEPLAPGCSYAPARRAGNADMGGTTYRSRTGDALGCYRGDDPADPTLLRLAPGDGGAATVVVGTDHFLHNQRLADRGNASLALQLLGEHPRLVWYLPSPDDEAAVPEEGRKTFFELVPDGWVFGAVQLGVAAVLAALWRSRRLGPVVTEPLPVTVRAAETTEGRARLYRRANARDRAAESLRRAARARLAPLVGVAPASAHDPAVLVPAVTARTGSALPGTDLPGSTQPGGPQPGSTPPGSTPHGSTGTTGPGAPVRTALFGPAPRDDAALVRLADELDALERQVREQ
ncbi:DUF4350 domain-containing protein [Streptomyces thermolineatus]|uniref:DUF4350 domain-containing protein n=1 Tax=Streptomyces thermolineatus TaxID=44033 RepID=UPI00384AB8D2